MDPVEITGLGEGRAVGYGNVKLLFIADDGSKVTKMLQNVWYLPVPV